MLAHAGDMRDVPAVIGRGIEAIVDLAMDEAPLVVPRHIAYCRFPLIDGGGSSSWMIHLAVHTTAGLLGRRVPTVVYCSAGMSRSPAVAAAAIAMATGKPCEGMLEMVTSGHPADVSPVLWGQVRAVVDDLP